MWREVFFKVCLIHFVKIVPFKVQPLRNYKAIKHNHVQYEILQYKIQQNANNYTHAVDNCKI